MINLKCRECDSITSHEKVSAGIYDCTICGTEKKALPFYPDKVKYIQQSNWCPICREQTIHNFSTDGAHCSDCGRPSALTVRTDR